jgi:hypothetical protein
MKSQTDLRNKESQEKFCIEISKISKNSASFLNNEFT